MVKDVPRYHDVKQRLEVVNINSRALPKGPMTDMLQTLRAATKDNLDEVRAAIKMVKDADPSDTSCVVNRSIGTEDGMTVLQYTIVSCMDPEVTKLLMSLGGDSNKRDSYGRNALHHIAIASGRIKETTSQLIRHIEKVVVRRFHPGCEYKGCGSAIDREAHELAANMIPGAIITEETPIDWNAQDDFLCTPLHYTAEMKENHGLLFQLAGKDRIMLRALDCRFRFPHENVEVEHYRKYLEDKIKEAIKKKQGNYYLHWKSHDTSQLFHTAAVFDGFSWDRLDAYYTADPSRIDEVTCDGQTPLHCAAGRNSLRCAEYFIKHHANPHIRDNFGQLPIDIATSPSMRGVLQDAMETPAKQ